MCDRHNWRRLADPVTPNLEGEPRGALEDLSRAAKRCFDTGQYEAALECYSKLLDLRPRHATAVFNQAVCLERLGRWGDSRATYETVIETNPDCAQAHLGLGSCLLHLGLHLDALAAFRRAQELLPAHPDALLGEAAALQLGGRLDAAAEVYARVLAANPDSEAALSNQLASALSRNDFETARGSATRLLELCPRSATAAAGLAACSFHEDDFEAAASRLREVIEIAPDDFDAWFHLGMTCRKLGRFDEAVEAYTHADQLEPGWPHVQWGLRLVHQEMSELARATVPDRKGPGTSSGCSHSSPACPAPARAARR
jgi:superkiller protein 3